MFRLADQFCDQRQQAWDSGGPISIELVPIVKLSIKPDPKN